MESAATADFSIGANLMPVANLRDRQFASPPGPVEELARRAAHDLRAPVRQIKSFALLLLEDLGPEATPETKQDVDQILQGAERLQVLIEGFSELALVGAKSIELGAVPVTTGLEVDEVQLSVSDPAPLALADFEMLRTFWGQLPSAAKTLSLDGELPKVWIEERPEDSIAIRVAVERPAFGLADVQRSFGALPAFPGHEHDPGAGFAICRRAIERIGGSMKAESGPDDGLLLRVILRSASWSLDAAQPSGQDSVSS